MHFVYLIMEYFGESNLGMNIMPQSSLRFSMNLSIVWFVAALSTIVYAGCPDGYTVTKWDVDKPSDIYRKWVLNDVSHTFSESDVSKLIDLSITDFVEFQKQITPFEKKYINRMRFNLSVDVIKSLNEELIYYNKLSDDKIASNCDNWNFMTVFGPFYDSQYMDPLENSIGFLSQVSPDIAIRDAATQASQNMSDYAIKAASRPELFAAYKYILNNEEIMSKLNAEEKRMVNFVFRDGKRSGLDLNAPDREEVTKIQQQISQSAIDFQQNLANDTSSIWVTKDQLKGLSDAQIARYTKVGGEEARKRKSSSSKSMILSGETLSFPSSSNTRLHDKDEQEDEDRTSLSSGEKEVYYEITMSYPDYTPCIESCEDENVRKALATKYNSRAMEKNTKLIENIFYLRANLAKLMGYPNYASHVLETRMAKDPSTVANFLDDLDNKLNNAYDNELAILENLKRSNVGSSETLQAYDRAFYIRKYEEQVQGFDKETLREYFPLLHVEKQMLGLFEKLLAIKFCPVNLEDMGSVWIDNDDARLFRVFDQGKVSSDNPFEECETLIANYNYEKTNSDASVVKRELGHLYVDLYPRKGKYGHAAVFGLSRSFLTQPSIAEATQTSVGRTLSVAALVCNFPRPVGDRPSLLSLGEVTTFFHELGHAVHQMLSRAETPRLSGLGVERDFVEAPSQMLENWVLEEKIFNMIHGHYTDFDNKKLDSAVVKKLLDTQRIFLPATNAKRQLVLAKFDQMAHKLAPSKDTFQVHEFFDSAAEYGKLHEQILKISALPNTNMIATFGHLASGYDATYYGYLWSEVYAADMFESKFKNDPLNADVGWEYREKILGKGASKDAADMLRDFLGRNPSNEPFLRLKGIIS